MWGKSPGERTETKGRVSRPQAPFIEGDVQERADQATDEGERDGLEKFSRPSKGPTICCDLGPG